MTQHSGETEAGHRRRDAEATRAAILDAAREIFTLRGYDGAGTREIAERAGVNAALISRYFGSKEGLFREAVPPLLTLDPLLADAGGDLPGRLAAHYVEKPAPGAVDPMVALLRAASNPEASARLREALEAQVIAPLADTIGGRDSYERACLIAGLLGGYDLVTRILGIGAGSIDRDAMRARLTAALDALASDGGAR